MKHAAFEEESHNMSGSLRQADCIWHKGGTIAQEHLRQCQQTSVLLLDILTCKSREGGWRQVKYALSVAE